MMMIPQLNDYVVKEMKEVLEMFCTWVVLYSKLFFYYLNVSETNVVKPYTGMQHRRCLRPTPHKNHSTRSSLKNHLLIFTQLDT